MNLAPALTLAFGFVAFALAVIVHRPPRRPAPLAIAAFLPGWLQGELPLHTLAVELLALAALVAAGGASETPGVLGVALTLGAAGLHVASFTLTRATVAAVAASHGLAELPGPRGLRALWPFLPDRRGVVRACALPFATDVHRGLTADLYLPAALAPSATTDPAHASTAPAPILVFVHGGAWILGFRRFQGLPLLHRLARAGWICVSIGYRRSPRATFPDHVVDVKRALAWVRARATEWGGDPERIAVAGNSAGAHLAALAALTPGHAPWQPGFEGADTGVAACVALYGIYDLLHRERQWPHRGLRLLFERAIIKRPLARAEGLFCEASPWDHVTAEAPPFLVVHGTHDSVVPVAEARAFVAHFDRVAPGRATAVELPGAQHAFDVFDSPRALAAVEVIAAWLDRQLRPDG